MRARSNPERRDAQQDSSAIVCPRINPRTGYFPASGLVGFSPAYDAFARALDLDEADATGVLRPLRSAVGSAFESLATRIGK
jgi:hypothetical protein